MKVIVVKDYDAVSKEAFDVMKEVVTSKKDAVLGLATGSSPIGLYKNMIQDHKDNGTSYAQCQSFNLDEYVGIDRNHPESYWTFMHENLFKGIDLPEDKIHVPYGSTKEDCEGYEKAMKMSVWMCRFWESAVTDTSVSMSRVHRLQRKHTLLS